MLLALASALSYGLSDFLGGLASRRAWFLRTAFIGQVGGMVSMAAIAPLFSTNVPSTDAIVWGGLSGLGTGMAMAFLFRGMGRSAMSIVVPTSAVAGVALPVLIGVVALGERPTFLAWAGVVLTPPALWLVSHRKLGGNPPDAAVRDGLISGGGVAVQYLALAQAGPGSGIWPVVAGRVTAVFALALAWKVMRSSVSLRSGTRAPADLAATVAGVLAGLALAAYLFATRTELMTVAVVLSSLYPIMPVLLAVTVLHERIMWHQSVGMVGTFGAVVLLATG
jgi:drug/metabolite transporter (DMT)-like permease